ncbi:alcohol dehydrogenase [Candidatus Thioglobus autotrophicus]|jgi:dTDP-glucose pyrophosphorylase|uniref:Alcohol dehydrogenase n=1 Tax=Candidatus Thioglobus autotrophicus TaxID=1705394 RepID=A0A0M4NT63_9GAMM|nr:nucleotidyltransferase family protein [Candidatus Thioglobus autotrophicus]ALE52169.1 alcohol dehydrogenase [Candidatus Thioglobus autotrophicus]
MHNWKKTILKVEDTMEVAIKILNQESLRIVMVVDDDERLIGSITDGDIRRGLISQLPMNTLLTEIMHKNPIVVLAGGDKSNILAKMKELDLLQIPIVDSDGRIVGLETLQHLIEKKKFNNPVFLMAGGFGKRLAPLTNNTPKPLLKVGNKPILENIINQFIDAGFYNFYISTHYKAEMVREYFGDGSDWNVSIKYIYEDEPLGTAGSLGLLPDNLPRLPILMMNGDLLTKIDFKELLRFHLQEGEDVTMCVREYDFQVPYGVVETNGKYVISIEEKPIHRFFVNAGIYVLNPSMLDMVDGKSYLDMPQLLEQKRRDSGKINMFPVHEYWLDIGQIEQFDQAQRDVSQFS